MAETETVTKLEFWDKIAEGQVGDNSLINSEYFKEYLTRLKSNRDMHVLFTGEGETGVGKTTLAIANCMICDLYEFTADKAKYSVPEFNMSYFEVEPGEWLLADDVQKWMDKRQSMKSRQREQTTDIQANRLRQVNVAWTAPSKSWLDKRLGEDIVDYWIQCLEGEDGEPAGKGRVYRLKSEEHYQTEMKTKTEIVTWPILDNYPIYKKINQKKLEWLRGDIQQRYVHVDEFEDAKKNFWNKATKKTRYEIVKGVYQYCQKNDISFSQEKLGTAIGEVNDDLALSQPRVNDIVKSGSFEEVYNS